MKTKFESITNLPFVICLILLLLNDFYFKAAYYSWLTGKLSDFAGLVIFSSFWTAIFPDRKRTVYYSTALLFVIWKSPYSQSFIDLFSQNLYTIHRVVDVTDLFALLILPIAFFYQPGPSGKLNLNPVPLALLAIFTFCATSVPQYTQKFNHPQYILFRSGIVNFENVDYPSDYQVYELDSLVIISIKEIRIDKPGALDDDFQKKQILAALDMRLLRDSQTGYGNKNYLSDYEMLKDSLTVKGRTSITLDLDSITDELNFKATRLDGNFRRLSSNNQLLMEGKFKNGIEDSIWTFFNAGYEVVAREYFENGELVKLEKFENSELTSEQSHNTRDDTIKNKYFHLATIGLLILMLLTKLTLNYKEQDRKGPSHLSNLGKIAGTLLLPLAVLIVAKLISSLIPFSYSAFFLGVFGEGIVVYIVTVPLFLLIFYLLKLRSRYDLIFYVVLFALFVVLVEEWIYLKALAN